MPKDPWGHPYLYKTPGDHAPYEIDSLWRGRRRRFTKPHQERVALMLQTDAEAGFTLIEVVCVLAIIGLLAALVLPAIPRGTSQERLAGYAVEVAALLKGDRNAAMRDHAQVATSLDAGRRIVISGATASSSSSSRCDLPGAACAALRRQACRRDDRFLSVRRCRAAALSLSRGRASDIKFASTG